MEDIADTQIIEMRMRSCGTGRWAVGLIKGLSLIYNTVHLHQYLRIEYTIFVHMHMHNNNNTIMCRHFVAFEHLQV